MSQDRVVRWKGKRRPSKKHINLILLDFFCGAAIVEWKKDRFYCHLSGRVSYPLRHIPKMYKMPPPEKGFEERYIEVWKDQTCLYVMTRQMDDFTNGIAERLTDVFVRAYQAEREPD